MLGVHCRERKAADRRHCNETCCRRMTANKNARAGCSARLGLKELVTDHRRIVGARGNGLWRMRLLCV